MQTAIYTLHKTIDTVDKNISCTCRKILRYSLYMPSHIHIVLLVW